MSTEEQKERTYGGELAFQLKNTLKSMEAVNIEMFQLKDELKRKEDTLEVLRAQKRVLEDQIRGFDVGCKE